MMLSPLAPCSLRLDLLWISLLPPPGVTSAIGSSAGQAFRSLGNDLDVSWIRNVVETVPANGSSLNAPAVVDYLGNRFEMVGIDASPNSTSMIDLQAGRYVASMMDPESPGGDGLSVQNPAQDSVTISMHWSPPDPAPSFIDLVSSPVVDEGFGHVPDSSSGGM